MDEKSKYIVFLSDSIIGVGTCKTEQKLKRKENECFYLLMNIYVIIFYNVYIEKVTTLHKNCEESKEMFCAIKWNEISLTIIRYSNLYTSDSHLVYYCKGTVQLNAVVKKIEKLVGKWKWAILKQISIFCTKWALVLALYWITHLFTTTKWQLCILTRIVSNGGESKCKSWLIYQSMAWYTIKNQEALQYT